MTNKYVFTADMYEISGFGGDYEDACRKMVIAGLEFCDANPDVFINYKEFKNVYGITTDETDDCKKMQKAMLAAVEDCTGAMMQASMNHVMSIRLIGWDKYVEESRRKKRDEAKNGGG